MTRRYFTEEHAHRLIGRRVQARVAICLGRVRGRGFWVEAGDQGTVTQLAFGSRADQYVVGVAWHDPRPLIPRFNDRYYPINWFTPDEYDSLLKSPVEGEEALLRRAAERVLRARHDLAERPA